MYKDIYCHADNRFTLFINPLSKTHRRPIGDPLETYRRPIRDRHAWSETHWRPRHASWDLPDQRLTCLIGDPSETDMPDRIPRHDSSETDMPNRRPKIASSETHRRSRHASLETHLKPTKPIGDQQKCLIGDRLKTDMPNQKPTRDQHAWLESLHYSNL